MLTLWTANPELARRADAAGVDRIGVDLETEGKAERQRGRGTWISPHRLEDLEALRQSLSSARLFARTNPVGPRTPAEVEALLVAGVEVLMLPMFHGAEEVATFLSAVNGRAAIVLLLERFEAIVDLKRILALPGIDEVHVGINDLSIALGLPNRFYVYLHPAVAAAGGQVREAGLRFGIGGIGRVGDDRLSLPSDLIYAQYPRLGATSALISRVFIEPDWRSVDLAGEVARARARLDHWQAQDGSELEQARACLERSLAQVDSW